MACIAVRALGCGEAAQTPIAPGEGSGGPINIGGSNSATGGSGGSGGSGGQGGGGIGGAGGQGGQAVGACQNESDLEILLGEGSLRDVARTCGLSSCISMIGNSSAYESCVTSCVEEAVEGLSNPCAACYGGVESCGLDAFCRVLCQSGSCNAGCLSCLRMAGCEEEFEACRGVSGFECAE